MRVDVRRTYGTKRPTAKDFSPSALAWRIAQKLPWKCTRDVARLRWALKSSARRLKGFQACEQGAGLIDIPAAWEALQHAPEPVAIEVRAPVHTALSRDLPVPEEGAGLYEREGWHAGISAVRTIRLKRLSGSSAPVSYVLRWAGNDGTFQCLSSLRLPLDREVNLPVRVHPATTGIHSALLQIRERSRGKVIGEVMTTVIAAEPLTKEGGVSVLRRREAEWQRNRAFYYDVPQGVEALDFEVALTQGEKATFSLLGPDGQGHKSTETHTANTLHIMVPKPQSGVWEAIIENGTTQGTVDVRHVLPLSALFTLRTSVR